MAKSVIQLQTKLTREYYKDFSKFSRGKAPEKKVAWVTAFTPVEILEALGMTYVYPESYAAVIAASEKEQNMLRESEISGLSLDCCSYSCCIEGCLNLNEGPRGIPPKPDILIATNNQCSTLPNWWNILALRYNVPLIVLDYPGDRVDKNYAFGYVTEQHKRLIKCLEELTQNNLDFNVLNELISNSENSVCYWNNIINNWNKHEISPTSLFDDINFLITSRCKPDTIELYKKISEQINDLPLSTDNRIPLFWLGYPLWYHTDRYLKNLLDDFRLVGSNYLTWWSLGYEGKDVWGKLFNAYNFTFLNLNQVARTQRLSDCIKSSGAKCAVTLHNKSCKCDFVSAQNIEIPQAEIEIDMIDRTYLYEEKAKKQIELLKETICSE